MRTCGRGNIMNNTMALALMAVLLAGRLAAEAPAPPDLTVDRGVDRKLTYNLGATGMRGWIYTKPAAFLDSVQGRTTTASRQILVTHVGKDTPADGVMNVDDVILGAGGNPFSDDARKSIAMAIQAAEKTGVLKLIRWREGKTEEVKLQMRVLGAYSGTAPFDCPKSRVIFEDACRALEKEPLKDDLWGAVNGLALLAAGKPEYLPQVRELAHKIGPPGLDLKNRRGMVVWEWGYKNLFLCEYYLITRDPDVLHAIREYTVTLARGQSRYGTFGHGLSELTEDGKLHGSIQPYGPVNAAGLIGNLAIILGGKCGVQDPEIAPAITRANRFFGYFVDKGAIPYGEHEPWPYHENNGKNSMAAVMYGVQGDRTKAAQFYAMMATAAYANREYGHTGQGFSYLWGALGANVGGPAAAAAFFREASWHFDLARRCDGSFTYDGGEQYGPGRTHDDTYQGRSSYNGLSPNACYVLAYSLPLKKLLITGRGSKPADALTKADVAAAVASGRFDVEREKKTPDQLVAAFNDWSPIVRGWAAEELARRPEAASMVPALIRMAADGGVHVRQGACEALGRIQDPAALPVLLRQLDHDDRWVRYKAAEAIQKLEGAAKPAVADLLGAVARTGEPLEPVNWADPIQIAHGQLAKALFQGALTAELRKAGPDLLHPAIRAVSRNADGMARATLRGYFERHLTREDVVSLAPDILAAVRVRCPADTMFGNEIRMGGFKALTKYHFREGIEAGVVFAKTQGGHGSENRTGEIMKEIAGYGTAARGAIPQLRELIAAMNAQCERGEFPKGELNNRRVTAIEDAIRSIEAATTQPELLSVGG